MPDQQGAANASFRVSTGSTTFQERLDVTILNPVQFAPAQNVNKMDTNGIWNAILIPGTASIRCSIV